MMNYEPPNYSITEFILCGALIGVSMCYFLYAIYELFQDKNLSAIEYAGIGLFALGSRVDPLKYFMDYLTFPMSFIERSGRDTWTTKIATILGLLLWLVGFGGNWMGVH